jgi:hypothetical protein
MRPFDGARFKRAPPRKPPSRYRKPLSQYRKTTAHVLTTAHFSIDSLQPLYPSYKKVRRGAPCAVVGQPWKAPAARTKTQGLKKCSRLDPPPPIRRARCRFVPNKFAGCERDNSGTCYRNQPQRSVVRVFFLSQRKLAAAAVLGPDLAPPATVLAAIVFTQAKRARERRDITRTPRAHNY